MKVLMNSNNFNLTGGKRKPHKQTQLTPHSNKLPSELSQLSIPSKFPSVGVLTNEILYRTPLTEFVYLEKTDGLHTNIILFNDKIYDLRFGTANVIKTLANTYKLSIIDTELYNGMYYVFDASTVDNLDISNKSYIERMETISAFIKAHEELSSIFVIKSFDAVDKNKLPSLIDLIYTTNISPKTGNHIDGLIFQLINVPYFAKQTITYKLKRAVLNTIDFKLIYDETDEMFYLYLIGNYRHVIYNKKHLPHINDKSQSHVGVDLKSHQLPNESFYILFSSPYFENLHLFYPTTDYNKSLYFPDEQANIDALMKDMMEHPTNYNNKIVEMSLNTTSRMDNYWVPMRVREDKQNSNAYDVGLSNVSVSFNPITKASINDENNYFTKSKLFFPESITSPYHDINKLIRKFNIEHVIGKGLMKSIKSRYGLSVLDLAGGRGADELTLFHCGVRNIFAMDADKTALVQYVERTANTPRLDYKHILNDINEPTNLVKHILINAVQGYLGSDNSEILDDITSRYEYPKNGFDCVLMNYAIHYLADNDDSINELLNMIHEVLTANGLFIFTCFDGESIKAEIIKGRGVANVGPFSIKMTSDKIAHMPLPTIDASGYRDEPLVLKHTIDLIKSDKRFKVVEEYSPMSYVSKLKDYHDIVDSEHVNEFLNYIRVYVLAKV